MKLRILLAFVGLLAISEMNAQVLNEQPKTMSMGTHNGFFMEFEEAQRKNVEKLWKEYLKDYSKKVKKKKKEYYTEEGRIPIVNGSAELTLYSSLEEGRNQTTLYTWLDLGGVFMNSEDHNTQVAGFEQFMEDFFYIVRKDVINRNLEEEEKVLKNLNKDLSKLADKNEDYHNEILKAQEKIRMAEENIVKNLAFQEEKRAEIDRQEKRIQEIIDKLNRTGKSK